MAADNYYSRQAPREYDEQMYDERHTATRYHRDSPSPRRYNLAHDRSRAGPRTGHGRDEYQDQRDWNDRDRDRHVPGRSPQRENPRGNYRDRDREDYRSPRRDSRSRSRSPRRRSRSPYYGGPPSREIMMDDLPLDLVEEDIKKELKRFHDVDDLDDIRIIRDRQTKASRGFGFLRFPTMEKAKAFLERNYPVIYLYGNGSTDSDEKAAKVRLAYSREREERPRGDKGGDGDWICKICSFVNFPGRKLCFKCHAPYSETLAALQNKEPEFVNSGDSDASPQGQPSQFLLIRNLEPTVTEELLAKGVAKLYKPSASTAQSGPPSSKKGQAKVASTTGDANLGAREGSIRRVLLVRDRRTDESWRYGFAEFLTVEDAQAAVVRYNSYERFTISSKPVTVTYIHAGVFVPVFRSFEGYEHFTFSPSGNTATKLQYWDENAYVSELVVSKPEEITGTKIRDAQKSAAELAVATASKEGLVSTKEDGDTKGRKRKTTDKDPLKQKKTAPAHLQFWSDRHAELHGVKRQEAQNEESNESHSDGNDGVSEVKETKTPKMPKKIQSFGNPTKLCCYLCSRQFKTAEELNKHERVSDLHRDNMKNEDLKTKALAKMTKAGISPQYLEEDGPEYRDRAKERRAAFGASKKISLPMKKPASAKETPKSANDSTPSQSKGAALLGKMGWAAGEGLGAEGKGMKAPIATEVYAAGVGLGAQGGKLGDAVNEAERNTKGSYSDFLERAKDKAKERYESMS